MNIFVIIGWTDDKCPSLCNCEGRVIVRRATAMDVIPVASLSHFIINAKGGLVTIIPRRLVPFVTEVELSATLFFSN